MAFERIGIWLLGTAEERRRMRETEAATSKARAWSAAAIVLAVPFLVGGYGAWVLGAAVVWIGFTAYCNRRARTSASPELWPLAVSLFTQAMFALAAVAMGGPTSPAMFWLCVALVPAPARYGPRGMGVVAGVTAVLMLGVALSHGVAQLVAHPETTVVALSTGFSCFVFAAGMRTAEFTQRRRAVLDPLTGLLNRASLRPRFEELSELAALHGRPVSMLICDLDHFKVVNDCHGHERGDAVLTEAASRLREVLGDDELIYRYGGEEFVVVQPGLTIRQAEVIGERIRASIASAPLGGLPVTVSVGVATAAADAIDFDQLFRAADAALYAAKDAGRNGVIAAPLLNGAGPCSASDDDTRLVA